MALLLHVSLELWTLLDSVYVLYGLEIYHSMFVPCFEVDGEL
jgi:hypothetical protein